MQTLQTVQEEIIWFIDVIYSIFRALTNTLFSHLHNLLNLREVNPFKSMPAKIYPKKFLNKFLGKQKI